MKRDFYGALVGRGLDQDRIFDGNDPAARDGVNEPYILLQQALGRQGLHLHTADVLVARGLRPDFEIHLNAQHARTLVPAYVLLFETPHIRPLNANRNVLRRYRKVFTWRPDWIDGQQFLPMAFPNVFQIPQADGLAQRPRMVCMIAGNKACTRHDGRELYSERVKTIRWFEQNRPADFELFGPGWARPAKSKNLLRQVGNAARKVGNQLWGRTEFPSWRGKVAAKRDVLLTTRFAICYENVKDFPGYITEKIFDCFFAGCVPVYWGPSDVTSVVPPACFIDRRHFATHEALYQALSAMDDAAYRACQTAMAEFLQSPAAQPYTAAYFARSVSADIVRDFMACTPEAAP